jgi:transmembrane sensor
MALDRYLADDMTPGDRASLEAWLAEDPSRARIVQALLAERNRRMMAQPKWDIDALVNRIEDRTSAKPVHPHSGKKARAARLFPATRSSRISGPWVRAAGIAATAVIVGTAGLVVSQKAQRVKPTVKMREYVTTRGQLASIYLADGTRVVLAPESRLHVPESISDRALSSQTATARDVRLEGAAYFEVVHDAKRPFSVETAVGVALDIGTEFEVRAYEPARPMEVTVVSGAVALHTKAQNSPLLGTLRRGDRGTLSRTGNFALAQNIDLGPTLAWTKGSLVFNHTPISEVTRELSRWYDLDVSLGQGVNPNRRLVLTLDNESAADALNLVALSLGLRVEERGRLVTLNPQ